MAEHSNGADNDIERLRGRPRIEAKAAQINRAHHIRSDSRAQDPVHGALRGRALAWRQNRHARPAVANSTPQQLCADRRDSPRDIHGGWAGVRLLGTCDGASQTFASWNHTTAWLRAVDTLTRAA
jgi:hypothetical protein